MDPYKPPKPIEQPAFLDADAKAVVCPHCDASYRGVPRKSFLGFQKHTCDSCRKNFNYPLYKGYRITFWVLLTILLMVFSRAPEGSQPSIFIILMGFAVVVDGWLLWKRK